MLVSRLGNDVSLAYGERRAVGRADGISGKASYYQDQNPENTRNSDFGRAFKEANAKLLESQGRLERLRRSEDLTQVQASQPAEAPNWVESLTHVSEWETRSVQRTQFLRTGW